LTGSPQEAPRTNRSQSERAWLGEATVLGTLTGLSYAVAYWFERGIADYYGYPYWMIDVGVSSVLLSLSSIILLASLVAMSVLSLLTLGVHLNARAVVTLVRTFRRPLGWIAGMVAVTVGVFSVDYFGWLAQAIVLGVTSIMFAILVAFEIGLVIRWTRLERRGRPLLEYWKLLADERAVEDRKHDEVSEVEVSVSMRLVQNRWFVRAFGFLLVSVPLAIVLGIVSAIGTGSVRGSDSYFVSTDSIPLVALRRYGDNLIAAQLDATSNRVKRTFKVLPLSSAAALTWELRHLHSVTIERQPE